MSSQAFDNLQLLLQLMQTTRNLAFTMRRNATAHIAMANAQSPDVTTLAKYVTDCAASYNSILSTAKTWVQANNMQATAAVGLIGATLTDLNSYASPLQTAATALAAADVATYAAIITACNAVLNTVTAPGSIYGS